METCILTIAGSDSTSGAGVQADVKTAASLGCYAASAVTCITAQSTASFEIVEACDPAAVTAQIKAVAGDFDLAAVKVGMLGSRGVVEAVAASLAELRAANPALPVVIDPVLGATAASTSIEDDVRGYDLAIARELLPLATLLTPNLPEAMKLADCCRVIMRGRELDDEHPLAAPPVADDATSAAWAARILIASGAQAVLVKGGHGSDVETVSDLLFCSQDLDGVTVHGVAADDPSFSVDLEVPSLDRYIRTPVRYTAPRLPGEFHGTGCALSTAIACGLAFGLSLPDAAGLGHAHLHTLLAKPLELGGGSYLIDHFSLNER